MSSQHTKVQHDPPSDIPCKIAFIGEAPGSEEVEMGRPLVGPSGRVFNALLRTSEILRSKCLVTNVFEEKADQNDVTPWMKDPAIYEPALARLEEEIKKYDPTVLVPLGATALWALTGSTSITALRGAVGKASRVAAGRKMVPTLHPAFVMRMWKYYSVVVGDLKKAAIEAERGPEVFLPKRRLLIDPSLKDLRECTPKCLGSDLLSVDIETAWGQITHVGMAWSVEEALVVPFVDSRVASNCYWKTVADEIEAWGFVREILESPTPKLGQFWAGYDALWLLDKVGIKSMNFREDTRLLHHALYPELDKSLAFLGAAYGTQGAWKTMGRRGGRDVIKEDE